MPSLNDLDAGNDALSIRVATIAPSGNRADTKPFGPSLSSTGEKFMAGVPTKLATNVVAGRE